ncbi:MAG: hypothetical protein WC343_05000 [Bacilli bacterium]|jgi:hypothetical protein
MKKTKVFIISLLVLIVSGCGINYSKLETELKTKVSDHYETYTKDMMLFAGAQNDAEQQVTLKMLSDTGFDISNFTDAGCDEEGSYAVIVYSTGDDGKQIGDYVVRNHLVCGEYVTAAE